VENLASYLFRSYGVAPSAIGLEIDIEDVPLNMDATIPCGLIISELISNAIKHAFPDGRKGKIYASLRSEGNRRFLSVSDSGACFPTDLDIEATETLGLHLVNALIQPLEGSLELDRMEETRFTISFVNPD